MCRRCRFLLWVWLAASAAFGAEVLERANAVARTYRVGVLTDNYPFSFRDGSGRMQGFAYDLVREVEQVMNLRFERIEGTTAEINPSFAGGRVDVLQSFAQSAERETMAEFSVPYLSMAGTIFVREGVTGVSGLSDLRGKKVMVHRGSLGEMLLRRAGLDDSIVFVDSVEQAFMRLDRGEGDATLATRLSGLSLAHQNRLTQVRPLAVEVPGYEVRYCIAVRKGEHALLARVNEGLAILVRTGRFDDLYRKWFGAIEPAKYTAAQVTMAVAAGLALALLVTLWAWRRQRGLHARITGQAEELRLSEERHRVIFEGAQDGLLVLGPVLANGDYPVERINRAARRLLSLADASPLPATLRALVPGDEKLYALVATAAAQRRPVEGEQARGADAGWWRVSVGPIGPGCLVALTDITETVRARERALQQEEQLRATQKLEAIGTLAGGVAHDFNNLLTAIMCNTELGLLTLPPGRPEAGNFDQVMKAARRARQLVRQILTFSRRSEPTWETLALSSLVAETAAFLQAVARDVVIDHVKAGILPAIVGDPVQIHQVLMNIGTNALQAMKGARGELTFTEEVVTVAAEDRGQHPDLKPGLYVRIGIRDTGPGMGPEVQRRIFEPFFTTKAAGEGTGLGLSVVHGIMQRHAGAVTVFSQAGRGTMFQLYFPAARTAAPAAPPDDPAQIPAGDGELVLVVDDEETIARTIGQMLGALGYCTLVFNRPEDAVAEFEQRSAEVAAVVTDFAMPGMTGLQLATRVRALRPDVPVVMVSGFFSKAEVGECEMAGIDHRLGKPFTHASLGRTVARAVHKGSVAPFAPG